MAGAVLGWLADHGNVSLQQVAVVLALDGRGAVVGSRRTAVVVAAVVGCGLGEVALSVVGHVIVVLLPLLLGPLLVALLHLRVHLRPAPPQLLGDFTYRKLGVLLLLFKSLFR